MVIDVIIDDSSLKNRSSLDRPGLCGHNYIKVQGQGSIFWSANFWNSFNFDIFCLLHLLAKSGIGFGGQFIDYESVYDIVYDL